MSPPAAALMGQRVVVDARLTQEMRERAGSAVVVCKPVKETEGIAIAPKLRIETPSPQPRK